MKTWLSIFGIQALWIEKVFAIPVADDLKVESRFLSSTDLLQWATGLGIVVILILLCAWLLKHLSGHVAPGSPRLMVLSGISVGSRERVILVQAGDRQLVLGVAPGRVQTLCILDSSEKITDSEPIEDRAAPAFSEVIRGVLHRG